MKKAQMETFGLMIVVVIILVAALIALRFLIISSSPVQNNEFLSIKANNIANSIKNADLCNSNFENAIINCCNKENFCDQDACKLVSKEIESILSYQDEKTYFEARNLKKDLCFGVGNCLNGITSSTYELKDGIEVNVKVCEK